jgi:hypothetical protein
MRALALAIVLSLAALAGTARANTYEFYVTSEQLRGCGGSLADPCHPLQQGAPVGFLTLPVDSGHYSFATFGGPMGPTTPWPDGLRASLPLMNTIPGIPYGGWPTCSGQIATICLDLTENADGTLSGSIKMDEEQNTLDAGGSGMSWNMYATCDCADATYTLTGYFLDPVPEPPSLALLLSALAALIAVAGRGRFLSPWLRWGRCPSAGYNCR